MGRQSFPNNYRSVEANFILSKETLKTVNEFAFCLLIGQIGSSFFVEEMFRVSIVFSCLQKNASNCIVASQKNESKSNNETNFVLFFFFGY